MSERDGADDSNLEVQMTDVMSSTRALLDGPFREERPFWDALDHGRFELPVCVGCGAWSWPVTPRCGRCGSFETLWRETPLEGSIYSWTRVWTGFAPERAAAGPFVVVLIELAAAGNSRVLGTLEGAETGLRIGQAVRGRIKEPSPQARGLASVVWAIVDDGEER
ncbi:MAG: Zn-ribbon domain-containing OB-fold protein [Desertimonas sp.]